MKKALWIVSLVLISVSLLGSSEYLIVYPGGLSLRGDHAILEENPIKLNVPSSILVNSFLGSLAYQSLQLHPKSSFQLKRELDQWVGKPLLWRLEDGSIKEYLVLSSDPVLVQGPEGVFVMPNPTPIFPKVSIPDPNTRLEIHFDSASQKEFQYFYLFNGLSWTIYYNLLLDRSNQAYLSGNIELANRTDMDWRTDNLFLFSGQIFQESAYSNQAFARSAMLMMEDTMAPESLQAEGYRLYPIHGSIEISPNSVSYQPFVQVPISYRKTHEYIAGSTEFTPLNQIIQIDKLPLDLPAGLIRTYADTDETTLFVGESRITDKNKGDELDIPIGKVYDLLAKREMIDSARFGKTSIESYRITVRNFSEEPTHALIKIPVYSNAQVVVDHYQFTRPRADLLMIILDPIHPLQTIEVNYEIRFDR